MTMTTPTRPTVLFLPGLLCDAELWAHQVEHLRDIVTPVVADLTRDDSIAAMARRAAEAAPGRFIVVALSMGGYVAFELFRTVADRIAGVALLDTTAAPDSAEKAAERRAGIASLAAGRFAGVTARLLPQLVHPAHVDGPVGARVRAMAQRVGGDAYVRQQRAILGRPDSRPLLPLIRVPALVVVGAQDALTPPAEAETMQKGIGGAALHVLPDCGHLPPFERPEETTALLRVWLEREVLPAF
jgi:pimeloyl-ACP methyl ester carboxylesterase